MVSRDREAAEDAKEEGLEAQISRLAELIGRLESKVGHGDAEDEATDQTPGNAAAVQAEGGRAPGERGCWGAGQAGRQQEQLQGQSVVSRLGVRSEEFMGAGTRGSAHGQRQRLTCSEVRGRKLELPPCRAEAKALWFDLQQRLSDEDGTNMVRPLPLPLLGLRPCASQDCLDPWGSMPQPPSLPGTIIREM
ncbi:hypothetical protein P7K49_036839 [Saguinus oedipus]|uniref:Uncharacterized protein n=1 Tax=Saguinus oedipus TaxID=9490 RepID=A0ABQ9TLG6_SAGOE|nr:hypothetical protein P7K49_036839 [Saguinus oedipus]